MSVRDLHRKLVRESGLPVRLYEVEQFFRYKGAATADSAARLAVRDLRVVSGAEREIEAFTSLVRFCVHRYFESDAPEVTSAEVRSELGMDQLESTKLRDLVQYEPNILRGMTTSADGEWSLQVADDMHLFKDVTSFEAYLAVQGELNPALYAPNPTGGPRPSPLQPAGQAGRDPSRVFLVRGRNDAAANALHDFLTSLGARVISWSEAHTAATQSTKKATPYVLDIVRAGIDLGQAVVVLMTPDDEVRLMDQHVDSESESAMSGQARPNVVLELGMSIALYPDRTILVTIGHLRSISDISGLYEIRMDGSVEKRQYLHDRLRDVGCAVHLQGRWTEAGDFANALTGVQGRREEIIETEGLAAGLDPKASAVLGSAEDDEPGFLDTLADGEAAIEEMVGVITEAGQLLSVTTGLTQKATEDMQRSDANGGGMRGRLAVVIQYAEALKPAVSRYEELTELYSAQWRAIHPALEYLLKRVETEEQTRNEIRDSGFLSTILTFATAVESGSKMLTQFATTVELSGSGSRQLRPVTNRLGKAARRWEEPAAIVNDWQARIDGLPD